MQRDDVRLDGGDRGEVDGRDELVPSIPAMIHWLARTRGEAPMLVDAESRLSFVDAERRSAQLARDLLDDGVGKGTRVGLLLPNGADWVLAWLAVARIGGIVVPVNTFSRPRELGWLLRHADVDTLICAPRFLTHDYLSALEEVAGGLGQRAGEPLWLPALPHLRKVRVMGRCDRGWAKSGTEAWPRFASDDHDRDEGLLEAVEGCVAPSDVMTLVYTSGSTAAPKGAVHTQGTIVRYARDMARVRGLAEDDRVYSGMPFFWAGGFVYGLVTVMAAGACLVSQEVFDAEEALTLMERERVTVALGWPHTAKAMAEHPSYAQRDLSALRAGNLYAILPEALRPADPELRHNSLGMTETCGPHAFADMNVDLPERLRGSFGRPVPGIEHRIVDPDTEEDQPPGSVGEVWVRGRNLMQGLYKQEREDVFDADGFYHTGDLGRFDGEGVFYFTGRRGDMIKTAGANVAPREVEVVLESLPEVKHAFVLGIVNPDRGQDVVAAVALVPGATADPTDLREGARGELSSYKLPRRVLIFDSAELPFLESDKIDRRALERLVIERLGGGAGEPGLA